MLLDENLHRPSKYITPENMEAMSEFIQNNKVSFFCVFSKQMTSNF